MKRPHLTALALLFAVPLLANAQIEHNPGDAEDEMPEGHESLCRQLDALTEGKDYTLIHARLEQPGVFAGTPKETRQTMTLLYGNGELYAFSAYTDIPTRMDELLGVSIFPSSQPDSDGSYHASAVKKEAIQASGGVMQRASESVHYDIIDDRIVDTRERSYYQKTDADIGILLEYMYLLTALGEWPLLDAQSDELVSMKGPTELHGVNLVASTVPSDMTIVGNHEIRIRTFPEQPGRDLVILLEPKGDDTLAIIHFNGGLDFSKTYHIAPPEKLAPGDSRVAAFQAQVLAQIDAAYTEANTPRPSTCAK
ncbi:MAG: hypothetical protein Q7Q73_13145 [Verrucomicrobiota bacterium JB024]|nr:hypothetical protein [Verrucomicrobiota bacterium JB024]